MYIFISIKMFDELTRVHIDARKLNVVFISRYLCIGTCGGTSGFSMRIFYYGNPKASVNSCVIKFARFSLGR